MKAFGVNSPFTQMTMEILTIKEAAERYRVSPGVLKAAAVSGRLTIYKLGTRYYTTPRDIEDWVDSCRVEQKGQDFTSIRRARSGSSETDRASSALAAARETAAALKNSLRNTSATSTSRYRQGRQ
jgi:hypothetical protein